MPLSEGPGIAISVNYVVPLRATSRGHTYVLLFTDRLRRRADMFAVTAVTFTDDVTANIFLNRHIPLCGFPRSTLSKKGLQVCLKLLHAVDVFVGFRKCHQLLPTKKQWRRGACEPHLSLIHI